MDGSQKAGGLQAGGRGRSTKANPLRAGDKPGRNTVSFSLVERSFVIQVPAQSLFQSSHAALRGRGAGVTNSTPRRGLCMGVGGGPSPPHSPPPPEEHKRLGPNALGVSAKPPLAPGGGNPAGTGARAGGARGRSTSRRTPSEWRIGKDAAGSAGRGPRPRGTGRKPGAPEKKVGRLQSAHLVPTVAFFQPGDP